MLQPPLLQPTLHTRLRTHTQARHRAVERTHGARALARGELPAVGLATLLGAWRAIWAVLEHAPAHRLPEGWHRVPRTPRIDADLAWLAETRSARPHPMAPALGAPLAALADTHLGEPSLFGVLYVLEGSAMGALPLARCLDRAGLHGAKAFHLPYGDTPHVAFGAFLELASRSLTTTDVPTVLDTADATFDAVRDLYAAPQLTEAP